MTAYYYKLSQFDRSLIVSLHSFKSLDFISLGLVVNFNLIIFLSKNSHVLQWYLASQMQYEN